MKTRSATSIALLHKPEAFNVHRDDLVLASARGIKEHALYEAEVDEYFTEIRFNQRSKANKIYYWFCFFAVIFYCVALYYMNS